MSRGAHRELGHQDVVSLGEPLVQLSPPSGRRLRTTGTLEVHTAGAEMNVALGLARLGHRSAFVGRVGRDPFGARILDELRSAGVDASAVVEDPERPTGLYLKDHDGNRTAVHYYRSGSAAAAMSPADLASLPASARWVHVSGITAAVSASCAALLDVLLEARPRRACVSFDVNHRPNLWPAERAAKVLLDLARRSDLVLVGRDEAARLWGAGSADAVRRLLPEVPAVVVKDAAVGATSIRGDEVTVVPSLPVRVVEAVGAGDAFAAGYLSARLGERDERTALRWGHLFAARALRTVADQVAPPPPDLLAEAADRDDAWWGGPKMMQHGYLHGELCFVAAGPARGGARRLTEEEV